MEIYYCKHCYFSLFRHGEIVSNTFEKICEVYLALNTNPRLFYIIEGRKHWMINIIRLLEIKRYIVTTEDSINSIAIKPEGIVRVLEDDNDVFFICLGENFHD